MRTIWAPWRMDFIASKKEPGCLFCNKLKEKKDRENLILYRSRHCFVIMNLYPYNNGHLMVVPNIHTPSIENLHDDMLLDFSKVTQYSIKCLNDLMKPEGFNLGINMGAAAGAGIKEHVHLHVVPRWAGDTNFMTTVSETKVIPEHILNTYDNLLKIFTK
ncbi:MAG: HIT domain-containing protein [Nitrospiraceae bacterium]|nr:HIT domain-containing protein [Nitrospiraceae bacterium]